MYYLRDNLRKVRLARGLTQKRLARLADMDLKHVQRIESKNAGASTR
jgi:transcriptional regulator with XRE-family HTH domain